MGVERQDKRKTVTLRCVTSSRTTAIGASLLFLFYLNGCLKKTVSQEDTPLPGPPVPIASKIEQQSSVESAHNIFSVMYPADMAVMEFNLLSISMKILQDSADLIEVEVNSHTMASIIPRRKVECVSVPLELGVNNLNIKATKEDRVVDVVALKVFRRSDLVGNYEKPPGGFKKAYFHSKDRSQCASCHHVLEPMEADDKSINMETYAAEVSENMAVVPVESTCYSCHREIISYSFVHGPCFLWSCLTCHDPQGEPKYSLKYPVPELCYECHAEQKRQRRGKKIYHAPYITDKCGICHNPHASENPCRLDKPIWLLCVSCHPDQGDGRHVIAPYFWGTRHRRHPTHGVPDPSRKGRELTCTSCHDPHASNSPMFITKYGPRSFDLCMKCHWKNVP